MTSIEDHQKRRSSTRKKRKNASHVKRNRRYMLMRFFFFLFFRRKNVSKRERDEEMIEKRKQKNEIQKKIQVKKMRTSPWQQCQNRWLLEPFWIICSNDNRSTFWSHVSLFFLCVFFLTFQRERRKTEKKEKKKRGEKIGGWRKQKISWISSRAFS